MPKAVVNSNILLTGAWPLAAHLVMKYPKWQRKPIIERVIPMLAHRFGLPFFIFISAYGPAENRDSD